MTSSGFEMPPDQKASQMRSIWLRRSPVSIDVRAIETAKRWSLTPLDWVSVAQCNFDQTKPYKVKWDPRSIVLPHVGLHYPIRRTELSVLGSSRLEQIDENREAALTACLM